MKKIIFATILFLLFAVLTQTAYAALVYGADYYRVNRRSALTGATSDPIRRFMVEVDSALYPITGTGTIYYVDSGVSSEGAGTSWATARNTLQEGIDLCTANNGDFVYVAQGHAENIASAAAIDADCAGITIVGFGEGEDIPTFSLTANLSTFAITAADVTLYNLRFLGAKTAGGSAQCVDVSADGDGARILGCEFRETSVDTELVIMLSLTADADECVIVGNRFIGFATGAGGDATGIDIEGGSDQTVIEDNYFYGDWSGYPIDGTDAASCVNILVKDNVVHNYDTTAGYTIAFDTATTGSMVGNRCYGNGASFALVGDAMFISPDNIAMQTENVETRNFESMLGAFTGPVSGAAQDDNIKASLDILHSAVGGGGGGSGTGGTYYVDSAMGASGAGTSWGTAVQTLDEAVALCTNNNGDYIYVASGHNENWTGVDSADLDIIGITVIGLGTGTDRPRFDYDDADAELVIGAANIRIYNLTFQPGLTGVTHAIEIEDDADGSVIENCEFFSGESEADDEFTDAIQLATAADDIIIIDNIANESTAGAASWLDASTGIVDNLIVMNNLVRGPYTDGCIYSNKALTNAYVADNVMTNTSTGVAAITFSSTASGTLIYNYASSDTPGTIIDPGSMEQAGNVEVDYGAAEDADAAPAWAAVAARTGNYPANIENDSLYALIMTMDNTGVATIGDFDNDTMSLEAIAADTDLILADTGTDGVVIGADALANANIADNAFSNEHLADNFLTATELATDCIGADELADDAIDAGVIAANAITNAEIANDAIGATEIATDAIDADALAADALAEIEAEAVDAIEADLLNKLIAEADADDPVDGSIIADLASKNATSDWTTYNNQTDSLEAIRDAIDGLTGFGFRGACQSNVTATTVICNDLAGFGDDYFNTGWSLTVLKNADTPGSAPEGVTVDITNYVSTTGTFTVLTTGTAVDVDDEIYVRRREELNLDDPTMLGASGNVWYVDSGASLGDGTGTTWENAFDTITLALDGATEDNGDVIYVAAGHSETLTAAYSINDHGVSIIGIGEGDLQPTIELNHVDAQFDVTVGDVLIENIKFEADLPNVKIAIDIATGGDGCHIKNCRFVDDTAVTDEFLQAIVLQAGADDVIIEGCEFLTLGGAATECIYLGDIVDNVQILNNYIYGDYVVAPIWGDATLTSALIKGNVVHQNTSGQYAIEFTTGSAALGQIVDNKLYSDSYATILDPGSMICIGNVGTDAINEDSIPIPLSAETSDVTSNRDGSALERLEFLCKYFETGTPGALVAPASTYSLLDILGSDGSVTTGALAGSLLGAIGTNEGTGDTPFASATVDADRDGSVLERLEYVQDFLVNGTPDKLTVPANTYTILDILGTDGSTTTGAVAGSILGAIGTNETAANTAFSSSTVEDDADGSVLERQEFLQDKSDDILAALGIDSAAANVWYVDSVAANGGTGTSWADSTNTLKLGIDAATNNTGAIIFVAPDHVEATITTSQAVDCPDITIIGLGNGSSKPTFTMTGAGGVFAHTVADVTWKNCRFVSSTIDTTAAITLDGSSDGALIEDCEFLSSTEFEFLSCITIGSACDDVTIRGCRFNNATSGATNATAAITNIAGITNGMTIEDCKFYGVWSVGAISSDDADTEVVVNNNIVQNTDTGVAAITFSAAALGTLSNNKVYGDTWGTIIDPGSLKCFENYAIDTIDESARLVPAASTVAGQVYASVCTTSTAFAEDLFSVSAPIFITNFAGIVTGEIAAGPGNLKVWCDATVAAQDADFSTAVACEGDTVGTKYVFTGACPSVLTPLANAAAGSTTAMESWFCPTGMIEQVNTDTDATGTIVWYMTWMCITDGTVVTAQ